MGTSNRGAKLASKDVKNVTTGLKMQKPSDNERIAAAIANVDDMYGVGDEKMKKLAGMSFRGVTMRPSGRWVSCDFSPILLFVY